MRTVLDIALLTVLSNVVIDLAWTTSRQDGIALTLLICLTMAIIGKVKPK